MKLLRIAGSLLVGVLLSSPVFAAERDRPNVLFISIDDLNDWVGAMDGHPFAQTPNIDRLAAQGTLFTNAHCQSPLCNSSRTSLMTGLRPSTTGVYALTPWIRRVEEFKDVVSLPQHFMASDYTIYSTGKLWHNRFPPAKEREGEGHYWGPEAEVGASPDEKMVPSTPLGNHKLMDWGAFPHREEDKGDYAVASWAVEQLEAGPQEPFFLGVGFFLPHVPCYVTPEWFEKFPDDPAILPPYKEDDRDDTPEFSWYMNWHLPEPRLSWLKENNQWVNLVRSYLASTAWVDTEVGRVLDALEASGAADNTIVVLWSDHGWHLGEKGVTGKTTLWDRSTGVPLIFAGPGITQGANCSQPAELLDIYPTLIELCGLPEREELEGRSLMPQLKDASAERKFPAITTHNQGNHGIRSENWRYIRYADGSEELYNMEKDPNEWHNLAGKTEHQDVIAELARFIPDKNVPAAPGSRMRLLENIDGVWHWEGKPIDPAEKQE